MCGVAGFLGGEPVGATEAESRLTLMGRQIAHRGPDSRGVWCDPEAGIGLAHQRLAILDLSNKGAQPMRSASGRFVMSYNGEIYNHLTLRDRLPGPWRGTSDTETLLAGFDAWGVRRTLEAAAGMFAFAVWDRQHRALTLARDRLGEKPLYYGWQASGGRAPTFLFGSELSALRVHPAFEDEIDRGAVSTFMRHANVSGAASIYRNIFKLPPGALLVLKTGDTAPHPVHYWSGAQVAAGGKASPLSSDSQAADELEALLRAAVKRQMIADVPLGVFLSGGVDSSTVAALAQAESSRPLSTFSIGFQERAFNEAHHARAVANHLGSDHIELYVSPRHALDVIPSLPAIYAEPFADSSQIPTYLLSKLARKHLTVALSGDGGDELFAGYRRHQFVSKIWPWIQRAPRPFRLGLAELLLSTGSRALDSGGAMASRFSSALADWLPTGERLHKGARLLSSQSLDDLYAGMVSPWPPKQNMVLGAPAETAGDLPALPALNDVERVMAWDMLSYLPDDVLTKVDRAAMAASLETRAPFLDHQVVEFAWRLPLDAKLRGGSSKWILREVLHRYVPRALLDRPKAGFAVPVEGWLRGELRPWAEDLLSETNLARHGLLDPKLIRRAWSEHLSGRRNHQQLIWNASMLQAWMDARGDQLFRAH